MKLQKNYENSKIIPTRVSILTKIIKARANLVEYILSDSLMTKSGSIITKQLYIHGS